MLSPQAIARLLAQQPITQRQPWASGDERLVEEYLRRVGIAVEKETQTHSRIEWDDYGSGYASFVDAWFYRTTPEFDVERSYRHGEAHVGLVVLLSRLSPYFVFMEGEKHWHAHGGSSYLPDFDMLDRLQTPAVASLAQQVQRVLESNGLERVLREQLEAPLAPGTHVPTNLADDGFTQFDALFHWLD